MKTKTLEEILKKKTKILLGILDPSNRERKEFLKQFESDKTCEKQSL